MPRMWAATLSIGKTLVAVAAADTQAAAVHTAGFVAAAAFAVGVEVEQEAAAAVDMQAVARHREQEAAEHIVAGTGCETAGMAAALVQTSEGEQRKGSSMVDTESRRAFGSRHKVLDIVAVAAQTEIPEGQAVVVGVVAAAAVAVGQSYVFAGAAVSQAAGRCSGVAAGKQANTGFVALVVAVSNPGFGPYPDSR
jgi:hypothetical protein